MGLGWSMTIAIDQAIQQKPLSVTPKICVQIARSGLPWSGLQRGLLCPSNTGMTVFRPDIAVSDCHANDLKTLELLRDRAINDPNEQLREWAKEQLAKRGSIKDSGKIQ